MFNDDRSYYQRRAEDEVARAKEATLEAVAQAHHQLAEAYLAKLASVEPAKVKGS